MTTWAGSSLRQNLDVRYPGLRYQLAAIGLVVIYVNAFQVWQRLVDLVGLRNADIVPLLLAGLLGLAALVVAVWRVRRGEAVRPGALAGAVLIAGLALLLVDPGYPAKRVHVAEYVVMALVVNRALGFHIRGMPLIVATALASALLGSHDELMQGLTAGRTFGLRDIGVNSVASLAGALLARALTGHGGARAANDDATARLSRWLGGRDWSVLAILIIGWLLLLLAIPAFRGYVVPLWTLVPLAAGGMAWAAARIENSADPGVRYFLATIAVLALTTVIYPLTTHVFPLAFH